MRKISAHVTVDADLLKAAQLAGINRSELFEKALVQELELGDSLKKTLAEIDETKAKLRALEARAKLLEKEQEKKKKQRGQVDVQALLTHLHKQVRLGKIEQGNAVSHLRTKLGLTPLESLKLYEKGVTKRKK